METVQEFTLDVGHKLFGHFVKRRDKGQICGEVIMVIPHPSGEVLVMTKAFYPDGVYRLLSGGMRCDEDPEEALARELREETGFNLPVQDFIGKLNYAVRCGESQIAFTSYVYLMQPTDQAPHCCDTDEQITGFHYCTPSELHTAAERLMDLSGDWQDWGRFRAIAHEFVAEALGYRHPQR